MEPSRNIAPVKLEMLMAIVHNEKAKYYSSLIQAHQANLQFIMPAKGTSHLILQYLGLEEKPKSLIISIVRSDEAGSLISELEETFKKGKPYKGIAFTVRLTSVIGTMVYGFLANEKTTVKEEA
jgi:hypothetical protein